MQIPVLIGHSTSKVTKSFGKTESKLLKIKIIIREFIFKPLVSKNNAQNYKKQHVAFLFKYQTAITLPI